MVTLKDEFHCFHYLSKKAEESDHKISPAILQASLKYHFDLSTEDTMLVFNKWYAGYIEYIKTNMEIPCND